MPAAKLDLTINRPVTMQVKDAAVWPGQLWPDPKTGEKKQLPPSLQLKGTVEGMGEVSTYIPSDFTSFLTNAGATSEQKTTQKGQTITVYTLPANRRTWVIGKMQDGGDRYPRVELYEPNANPLEEAPKALRSVPEPMPWDGKPAVHQEVPPVRATLEPSPVGSKHPFAALYGDCLTDVMALVRPYLDAEDPAVVFTGTDVAAMVATLFIARSRNA